VKLGKKGGVALEEYLAAERIVQGEEEAKSLGGRDWEDVVGRWGFEISRASRSIHSQ
jgi:hypothetical protein